MNEQFKEKVKYYTEWVRALLIIIISDLSGVISLMSKEQLNPTESVFLLFGIFSIFVLGIALARACWLIDEYIKKI